MNIISQEYLLQKFAEAREKQSEYYKQADTKYWSGIMDAYHSLLSHGFPGWSEHGTAGYYVFCEGMDYDKAVFYSRTGLTTKATT